MSIQLNPSRPSAEKVQTPAARAAEPETQASSQSAAGAVKDTYEKTESQTVSGRPDADKIRAMKLDFGRQVEAFNRMVSVLYRQQAGAETGLSFDLLAAMDRGGLKAALEGVQLDEAGRLEAEKMVSEDGEWGVEKTAQRIVDFAKALAGGDAGKIDALEQAVEKGFVQAERQWGDSLPDISQRTHARVGELFDAWRSESAAQA